MDSETLLKEWGFKENPFNVYTAEHEEDLPKFFVKPPYFKDIIGNIRSPKSSIIFGPRGDGKSAILKMVKYTLEKNNPNRPLIVQYTDFSKWNEGEIRNISLADHIERILGLAVKAFISELEKENWRLGKLKFNEQILLQWFILKFLPVTEYHQAENRLNSLFDNICQANFFIRKGEWLFRRTKSFLRLKRIEIDSASDSVSGAAQIAKMILIFFSPQVPGFKSLPRETMLDSLVKFKDLVLCAGFPSICILVDKVDETDVCNGKYNLAAALIAPMVTSLSFMELNDIATKLFLSKQIKEILGPAIRTDRILTRDISWSEDSLKIMLKRRLLTYSDNRIDSLNPFVASDILYKFDKILFYYSAMCPRNLIRILDLVMAELCETEEKPQKITEAALEAGKNQFLKVRSGEGDFKAYQNRLKEISESIEDLE